MKRFAVLLVTLAVAALGGCKSQSDEAAYSVEPTPPPAPPPAPPPPPPEPPAVATEEDFEEEVAKQITDKNIEKELDALAHELKPKN